MLKDNSLEFVCSTLEDSFLNFVPNSYSKLMLQMNFNVLRFFESISTWSMDAKGSFHCVWSLIVLRIFGVDVANCFSRGPFWSIFALVNDVIDVRGPNYLFYIFLANNVDVRRSYAWFLSSINFLNYSADARGGDRYLDIDFYWH